MDSPTVLLTGSSRGIGRAIAEALRARGARVIGHASSVGDGDTIAADFSDPIGPQLLWEEAIRRAGGRIDVLVNNAGTVFARRTLTPEGVESTFAVNHLAGFLLTELLLDRIRESAPARIVFTSSAGHYSGTLDLDDLGFARGYSIMRAYSRSKLANVLTARTLARRLEGTGVTVTSLHPGAIATNIWSGAPWFARPVLALMKRRMESPEVGGSRLAHLARSPEVEGQTGGYYERNQVREPSELARDDDLGERLYAVSAGLVGLAGAAT